jgi:hypothetical protein
MSSAALLFPSLTDSGRYRTNLNLSLRQELVKDYYVDLSFYHSYDSEPPDASARELRLRSDHIGGLFVLLKSGEHRLVGLPFEVRCHDLHLRRPERIENV